MRRNDDAGSAECIDRRGWKPVEPALDEIATIPVLLSLPALVFPPLKPSELASQAGQDGYDRRKKSSPVAVRPAGMHRAAVGAAPALDPKRLGEIVEVAENVAMAPEPPAAAARTPTRLWPRVALAQTHEFRQTYRQGKYQFATQSELIGGSGV